MIFGLSYGGVTPLYAILVREYVGERMGTAYGAVFLVSTLGMALGSWSGGWFFDTFGSYLWLYIGSTTIGLGAIAIALTFRPPRALPAGLPTPSPAADPPRGLLALTLSPLKWYQFATFSEGWTPRHTTPQSLPTQGNPD